jgi:lactate racemase
MASMGADLHPAGTLLGYGAGSVPFAFDPGQFEVIARHPAAPEVLLGDDDLDRALREPIASPPLTEIVQASDRVLVVVPDATRAARVDRIAPLVAAHLREAGVPDEHLSFLVGAGIHRAATDAEIGALLGPDLPRRCAVRSHDANDQAALVEVGRTRRGTPIELNRLLFENDRTIVVGAISFHYFAGFSGGRKAVLPGCASERAIRANHLLAFDSRALTRTPGVASGCLDGNPVHEDMVEAVESAAPSFLVNSVVGAGRDISHLYAGHWREAHRRGCDEYKESHTVKVGERRPLVVVSAGGAPRDVNLIQSHKAMEHAAVVLEEGGTMVVLAECGQGLGRSDFLDWFVPGGSRGTAQKLMGGDYRVNGQTAWGLRVKAERFRIRLVSTLPPEVVRAMGLEPCGSLESALDGLSGVPGYVLPSGLTTLPELKGA